VAKIYLIRHGESIANTLGIYQGQTYDTDLSPLGHRQVLTLRAFFANKQVDAIYSSPLTRTRKTAEQINYVTSAPVTVDHELLETNHGDWEGLPKAEIQNRWGDILNEWNTDPANVIFPGGESFVELQKRVLSRFDKLSTLNQDVVIVTHDNVIRIVVADLMGLSSKQFWQFPLDPAGVTTIIVAAGKVQLTNLNENTHLKACLTNLSLHAL
jgi:broad specificity phosphatase PhoE